MFPTDVNSPEYLAARDAAMMRVDLSSLDAGDPTGPCGHEYGLKVSTRLTTNFRTTWRPQSMDIKPSEVMECLQAADVQNWCLMGLHGYVGYLPMPRATQDVDVMVPLNQKRKAVKAISERWPELVREEFVPVVRFFDPGERDPNGNRIPVIDLMLPWGKFQETILREHVVTDSVTGARIPTPEAAIVAKYAALISPTRNPGKRMYDAGDLQNLIKTVHARLDVPRVQTLASEVWPGGSDEILRFIECALTDKPFPV